MKQIYNFEQHTPPVLNENLLRREFERRRLQREIALLAIGSFLVLFCVLLMAIQLYEAAPLLSFLCAAYICAAVMGGSIIALVFVKKRKVFEKCQE